MDRTVSAPVLKLFEQPRRPGIDAVDLDIVLDGIQEGLSDQRARIADHRLDPFS